MRTQLRNALLGALIGGGIAVLSVSVASAAETDGEDSILGGTQALLGIELPVTVGGNAISVLGDSASSGEAQAPAPDDGSAAAEPATSGTDGVAAGTQAVAPIELPITVGGNSISLLGDTWSSGAAEAPASGGGAAVAEPTTDGADGVGAGTQAVAPISVPVTVGGNSISLLGDASAADDGQLMPADGAGADATGPSTDGTDGTLAGTQVAAPLSVPITIGGNAVSVIGDTSSGTPPTGTDPGPTGPGAPGDPGTPGVPPADPGDSGPAAMVGTAALALTGAAPASPMLGLAAAALGLLLVGTRRILTVLRR